MNPAPIEAPLFALLAAFCLGAAMIFAKVGLRRMEPAAGALVSIPTTMFLFWCLAPWVIERQAWASPAIPIFAAVGLVFPLAVTLLTFEANHRMGPTTAATLGSVAPLFAAAGAVLALGEPFSIAILLGTLAIVAGVSLLSRQREGMRRTWPAIAILLPLGAAAIRGFSQLFLKSGLEILPNPFMAGLVGYTVSGVAMLVAALFRYGLGSGIRREGIKWFMATGLLNGSAMLALYTALTKGPVIVVAPITATFPLFTLLLSMVLLRQEPLGATAFAGALLVVGGVVVILL